MYRRYQERRRYRRHHYTDGSRGSIFTSAFRKPSSQIAVLLVVALVIFLILQFGGGNNKSLPATMSVDDAYKLYQNGAFFLDVRTVDEWNAFHAPNTTLVPLDQLSTRINEVPRDRQIVVVCRSGNRSQQGRDILLNAGYKQVTSMTGGLDEWRTSGYPITP